MTTFRGDQNSYEVTHHSKGDVCSWFINPVKLCATHYIYIFIYLFLFCFSKYVLGGQTVCSSRVSVPVLGHTQSLIQQVSGALFPVVKESVKATTFLQFVPRLGISGAIPPAPYVHGVVPNKAQGHCVRELRCGACGFSRFRCSGLCELR
jgi:hypothetical protein